MHGFRNTIIHFMLFFTFCDQTQSAELSPQSFPQNDVTPFLTKYSPQPAPILTIIHPSTPTMSVQTKATIASFGGKLLKLSHNASTTNCEMAFNLYLPPQATTNPLHKVPLLIYLAGLTCTGDNGAEKGFFQRAASEKGIAVLYPDTSPRITTLFPSPNPSPIPTNLQDPRLT